MPLTSGSKRFHSINNYEDRQAPTSGNKRSEANDSFIVYFDSNLGIYTSRIILSTESRNIIWEAWHFNPRYIQSYSLSVHY